MCESTYATYIRDVHPLSRDMEAARAEVEALRAEIDSARAAALAGLGRQEELRRLAEVKAAQDKEKRVEHLTGMAARRMGQKELAMGWQAWSELYHVKVHQRNLLQAGGRASDEAEAHHRLRAVACRLARRGSRTCGGARGGHPIVCSLPRWPTLRIWVKSRCVNHVGGL